MTSRRQGGFTLIELIIFIVVVGIGVAGILSVFSRSIQSSADPLVRKQALAIAESLLEEIVLKEFQDPDGGANGVSTCTLAAGSNRAQWDDVCDYNGYTTASGVTDVVGASITALAAYRIFPAVEVTTVSLGGINVKQVVVSVTGPQGVVSLTGYRGAY